MEGFWEWGRVEEDTYLRGWLYYLFSVLCYNHLASFTVHRSSLGGSTPD